MEYLGQGYVTEITIIITNIILRRARGHTSYLSILVHRRIIEVYKKYTKKLSELATK